MTHRRCPGCRGTRRPSRFEVWVGGVLAAARDAEEADRAAAAYVAARDAGDGPAARAAWERLVAAKMAYHATSDRERAEALAGYAVASLDGTLF